MMSGLRNGLALPKSSGAPSLSPVVCRLSRLSLSPVRRDKDPHRAISPLASDGR